MAYSIENPWIKERETIMDAWKPDYNRGYINNMWVNPACDFFSMSQNFMRQYAKMIKSFGFTGMQMTDSCAHWRWFGTYETDHDKKKMLCDALHAEGLKASLWVWASCFDGHGYSDTTVKYEAADGGSAYDDPEVFATFNKYYDIYADLAPYYDRLILHFFDPGRLKNFDDIIKFATLLESKFKAVNPNIEICVDTWSSPDDFPTNLVKAGKTDWMLMELPFLPSWGVPGRRENFRKGVKALGSKLGVWSWYTADIEIDQNARWVVNPKVIKDVYTKVREQGDHVMIPEYWSEMDSYHVLNLFSLYCSGQMLINPDRDTDELLDEIAHKIYGEKWGDKVYEVLKFVEDIRSGNNWDEYWWPGAFTPGVHVDFNEMKPRAHAALETMQQIVAGPEIETEQPLPVTPVQLAKLMIAHVDQLTQYVDFRVEMERLDKLAASGASKETLYAEIDKVWKPIPDYNVIVGVWGQPEVRVQTKIVWDFCHNNGIEVPKRGLLFYTLKKRYYEYLCSECRAYQVDVVSHHYYEGSYPFSFIEEDVLKSLEDDGLITILDDEKKRIKLNDFEAYKYR